MKVVSWNIHRCFGSDRRYRPDRIAAVLKDANADIIALQEIDSSLFGDASSDQLQYLSRELGMPAIMGPTLHRDYGAYGNAILSRYEVLGCDESDLSFRKNEPRGALAVSLRTPLGDVRVVNTHLGLKYWERTFQIDRLLSKLVWRSEERVIVTGDFNEWVPFSGNNLRLERAFERGSPRIATYPAAWPRFALDRIFISGPVGSLRTDVPRTALTQVASDHLPVIVSATLA